jgi:hypothetical protein
LVVLISGAMPFSELVALSAAFSAQDVVGEIPEPQPGLHSRIEALEGGLADVKDQQVRVLEQKQQLLDAVTVLARHVVRSPLERATSEVELPGSPVMVPSAVLPVSPTNTPAHSFQICSASCIC